MMRDFRNAVTVVLSMLLITSCINNQATPPITDGGNLPPPLPSAFSYGTPERTTSVLSPIAITETKTIWEPEMNPAASLLPTWTPLPTFSGPEKRDAIIRFLTKNSDCKLPCWWGIVPGETSLMTTRQYLSQFSDRIVDTNSGFGIAARVDGFSEEIASSYSSLDDDRNVSLIQVQPSGTAISYQLYQILEVYGKPESVVLDALPDSPASTPWFYLVVLYPKKGFSATYTGPAELENDKTRIKICPQGIDPTLILVKSDSVTLASLKNLSYGYPPDLPSLESYPEMNIDLFYENMQDSKSCFTVRVP